MTYSAGHLQHALEFFPLPEFDLERDHTPTDIDSGLQLFVNIWFSDVIISAGFKPFDDIAVFAFSGKQDQVYGIPSILLAKCPADCGTIHARHFNIAKNFTEVKQSIDLRFYGYVGQGE